MIKHGISRNSVYRGRKPCQAPARQQRNRWQRLPGSRRCHMPWRCSYCASIPRAMYRPCRSWSAESRRGRAPLEIGGLGLRARKCRRSR